MSQPLPADRDQRFHEVLAAHGAALRRLSRVYVSNPEDQDDLFQEIALAIWMALPGFRGDATVRTWVYRVAHNVALTFAAKRRRRGRESPLHDVRIEATPRDDARLDVAALIRDLPALDRQLLTLDLEGLTDREIAAVTGLTTANISVRLMRAKRRLAAAVQAIGGRHGRDA